MGAASTKPLKLGKLEGGKKDGASGGKAAKPSKVQSAPELPEIPSTMHVNMKKHDLGDVQVGGSIKGTYHGKVTGHHHDKYGHHADIEVHHLDVATGSADKGPKR